MNLRDRSPSRPDDRCRCGFTDDYSDPVREPMGIIPAVLLFVIAPIALTWLIVWLSTK